MVLFEARFWAEPIGFKITTSAKIESTIWQIHGLKGMHQLPWMELKTDYHYALLLQNLHIRPKLPFVMGIMFDQPGNPTQYISSVERWDGSGGKSSVQLISFDEESETRAK
jgi:hypothetical protein